MIEDQNTTTKTYGNPLLVWQVDAFPYFERSKLWYILATILGALCIVYAIATANFLFALIVLITGVIILITSFRKSERMDVIVTELGMVIGEAFYPFKEIKDFSVVYDPPTVKTLYLGFSSVLRPLLSIPLEEMDPNAVREHLSNFCKENTERNAESLTDSMRRVYKL